MKSIRLFLAVTALILTCSFSLSAQMMGPGMMGGSGMPEDMVKMMQEPNKVLAQASIQYMAVYTNALYTQSKERRDQIDASFMKSSFVEIKRAHEMIVKFQGAHVKTMGPDMMSKVKPMMERMDRNLASVKKNLDALEKEVNDGRDLDKTTLLTGELLKNLDDMPKGPGGTQGMPWQK
jgi:hypothetical protein